MVVCSHAMYTDNNNSKPYQEFEIAEIIRINVGKHIRLVFSREIASFQLIKLGMNEKGMNQTMRLCMFITLLFTACVFIYLVVRLIPHLLPPTDQPMVA